MSLDDRDWYRKEMRRRNSGSGSPNRSGYVHPNLRQLQSRPSASRGKIALVWLLILGGLFLLFRSAERNGQLAFAVSHIVELVHQERTRLFAFACVVLALALIRAVRGSRRRKQATAWQKAVYNPKEFRRKR